MKRKAPEKPKRPVKPASVAVQEQEIQLDTDRWSGFRDTFGEREIGIDADGSPIELLRLVREFTAVEPAIADRLARLTAADRPGIARSLRLEHDEQKRRPRLVLVSERIAGIRLSEAMARGIGRSVVPDIGAALYVMRRLFTTAESLHGATGVPHLIIAPERIVLTPRADIVITEAALAGATEALTTFPKALRLALSDVSGQDHAHRVDIARIARVGISMMLGRLIETNETIDALSPALDEIRDVASIRAGDAFATALRAWIEQAVTIDAGVSFASFRQAGEALGWTAPPKDCAPSRLTLKTFLNDLDLDDLRSPDSAALESERIVAIRARQTALRPLRAAPSVWDSLAPELGLARQDEILQESVEEIASKPLHEPGEVPPGREDMDQAGADEIDMSEAISEISLEPEPGAGAGEEAGVFDITEPIGELSLESFEIGSSPGSASLEAASPVPPPVAAPPPVSAATGSAGEPSKDLVIRAVASRFGFLLRDERGKKKPVLEPSPRGEIFVPEQPTVAPEPDAGAVIDGAAAWQEAASVDAAVIEVATVPAPIEWPAEPAPAPIVQVAPAGAEPEYEEAAGTEEPVAVADEPPSWRQAPDEIAEPVEIAEEVVPKRQKRSWFRAVAQQFGMGEHAEATEARATHQPAEAPWVADPEAQRTADEAIAHSVEDEATRLASEEEERRLVYQEAQWARETEAQHLVDEEARHVVDRETRSVAEAETHRTAEAEALRRADDDARRLMEAEARADARRLVDEDEAQRQAADLDARRQAAEDEALREAEEETGRLMAEAEARRQSEEDARRLSAEAEARRRSEEEAKRRVEAEARQRAEQDARRLAAEEDRRLAAEAEARRRAEEETKRRVEAEARLRAEQEARRLAEEEAQRLAAEAEARRRAEEETKRRVEAEARQRAEQESRRLAEEEAQRLAAEAGARRRAEEETRRTAEAAARQREADARQREAEARQRAEQETRRRADDEARQAAAEQEGQRRADEARVVAAEAEFLRLNAIAEAETQRLEGEADARRAAAQAEARRLAADVEARRLGEEDEEFEEEEPVEPASRATWVDSVAAEMGLKTEKPSDEAPSSWQAPTPSPRAPAVLMPPANAPQPSVSWQATAPQPQATSWQAPASAPTAPPVPAWQPAVTPLPQARESWQTESIHDAEPAAYEAVRASAESAGPSRLPGIADAVSRMMRSAAMFAMAAGLVGGVAWAGYSYYSNKLVPGTVVIESNPTGADIFIDGAAKGVTPLTIDLTAGQHKLELRRRGNSREFTLDVAAGEQMRQQIDLTNLKAMGILVVNSTPDGAKVSVDGRERGVTPLTLTDVDVGAHVVTIDSSAGSIKKNVEIEAGGKVTVDEGIFSGWIAVFAPFELQIFERKRRIGTTEDERIMLSAGRHELELVNAQRGFRDTRVVEVSPGATIAVNVLESETEGIVLVEAPPGTEVFIDGKRVGESPIGEQRVTVGPREILGRHPQLGEKKVTATVTSSKPSEVRIEFEPLP